MSFFANPFFNNNFFKGIFFHPGFHPFFAEPFFNGKTTTWATGALGDHTLNQISVAYSRAIEGILRIEDVEVKINGVPDVITHIEGAGGTLLTVTSAVAFADTDAVTIQIVPHLDNNLGELPHSEVIFS